MQIIIIIILLYASTFDIACPEPQKYCKVTTATYDCFTTYYLKKKLQAYIYFFRKLIQMNRINKTYFSTNVFQISSLNRIYVVANVINMHAKYWLHTTFVSERNIFKNGIKMCLPYDICDVLTFATYAPFFLFRLRSICSHLHYLDYHGRLCNCSRMTG